MSGAHRRSQGLPIDGDGGIKVINGVYKRVVCRIVAIYAIIGYMHHLMHEERRFPVFGDLADSCIKLRYIGRYAYLYNIIRALRAVKP